MDDDVKKKIGQKSNLKEYTLENQQSVMLSVSSSVVNHATLRTAGEPGGIIQNWGVSLEQITEPEFV